MKALTNIIVSVLAAVVVVVAALHLLSPQVVQQTVGSIAGPDIPFPYLTWGGVQAPQNSTSFRTSTTTVCSIVSPPATSTLDIASAMVTTASSTALFVEWGKSSLMDATTTSLGKSALGAGAQGVVLASTTGMFTSGQPMIDPAFVFAPSTYLNFKYGGMTCVDGGACSTLAGSCKARFIVN